jgi:hypothetical protein
MARTIDDDVRSFLDFWKKHRTEHLEIDDGLIQAAGCDKRIGGCCSDYYDLDDLADALEGLIGESRP